MKTTIAILALLLSMFVFPQDQIRYFSIELQSRISQYNQKLDKAFYADDVKRAEFLFDSLLNNHLVNTYFPRIHINKARGGKFDSENLSVPFVLINKSASMIQDSDEVDLINSVAKRFKDQIKIVIIYWGEKAVASKLSKAYGKQVIVTYADERKNDHDNFLSTFKHAFGVPTCFFVSSNKQLTNIDRVFSLASKNIDINSLESTNRNLALLLFNEDHIHDGIITTNEDGMIKEPGY